MNGSALTMAFNVIIPPEIDLSRMGMQREQIGQLLKVQWLCCRKLAFLLAFGERLLVLLSMSGIAQQLQPIKV
jgi:hypothetical protein